MDLTVRVALLAIVASCAALAEPSSGIPAGTFSFKLTPWRSTCAIGPQAAPVNCGLPEAAGEPRVVSIEVNGVTQPQSAAAASQDFSFIGAPERFSGRLSIFSVYPPPGSAFPPYVQTQLWLNSPQASMCAQSVRWQPTPDWPPLICAAFKRNIDHFTQWGVTFEFENFTAK